MYAAFQVTTPSNAQKKSLLATSLLGKHSHTGTTAASGLGVLSLDLQAPVVTETPAHASISQSAQ